MLLLFFIVGETSCALGLHHIRRFSMISWNHTKGCQTSITVLTVILILKLKFKLFLVSKFTLKMTLKLQHFIFEQVCWLVTETVCCLLRSYADLRQGRVYRSEWHWDLSLPSFLSALSSNFIDCEKLLSSFPACSSHSALRKEVLVFAFVSFGANLSQAA